MLIVTGGVQPVTGGETIDSTEMFTYGSDQPHWREAQPLPLPLSNLRGANIGNIFYLVGGYDGTDTRRDEIYSWDCTTESWAAAGHLATPRLSAGVAEVPFSAVAEFCSNSK